MLLKNQIKKLNEEYLTKLSKNINILKARKKNQCWKKNELTGNIDDSKNKK